MKKDLTNITSGVTIQTIQRERSERNENRIWFRLWKKAYWWAWAFQIFLEHGSESDSALCADHFHGCVSKSLSNPLWQFSRENGFTYFMFSPLFFIQPSHMSISGETPGTRMCRVFRFSDLFLNTKVMRLFGFHDDRRLPATRWLPPAKALTAQAPAKRRWSCRKQGRKAPPS